MTTIIETTLAAGHAPEAPAGRAIPVPPRALPAPDGSLVRVPLPPAVSVLWTEVPRPRFDVIVPAAQRRQIAVTLPDSRRSVLRVMHDTYVRRDHTGRAFIVTLSVISNPGTQGERAYPEVYVETRDEEVAEAAWAAAVRLLADPARILVTYGDPGRGETEVTWVSDIAFDAWLDACRYRPVSC